MSPIQNEVTEQKAGLAGMRGRVINSISLENDAGSTQAVTTLELGGTVAVDDTVTIKLIGVTIESLPAAATTLTDLASKLVDAIRANPVYNKTGVTSSGAVLTFTGRANFDVPVSTERALSTIVEVIPVSLGSSISPGVGVVSFLEGKCRNLKAGDEATIAANFVGIVQGTSNSLGGIFEHEDIVPITDLGSGWVHTETEVSVGEDVYIRHTANGNNTRIGGFSNAAGTGLVQIATGAKWVRADGSDLALLKVNVI